ncbi:MAG: hypothetical protein R3A80_12155 [Bdellovibrionota bacterium]
MRRKKELLFFILLSACQGVHSAKDLTLNENGFARSVSYLDPDRTENQLSDTTAYGQIILTVENDEVIKELNSIEEIHAAIEEITFIKSNNSFQSVVYVVQFKRNINPIPYYHFLGAYEGVLAAEFDGMVGLAGGMNLQY